MVCTEAEHEQETCTVREWFGTWIRRHKSRNPHARFIPYEAEGNDPYSGWILAFEERGTTRAEAVRASRILQSKAPGKGLLPEHHLPKLLAILEKIQRPRLVAEEAGRRAAAKAEAERLEADERRMRDAWALIPDAIRETYRDQVRDAQPAFTGRPRIVEALARHSWIQEVRPGRGEPGSLIEAWRDPSPAAGDGPDLAPPRAGRPSWGPGEPPPEPTADEVRRAHESRHHQLARLGAHPTPRAIAG